MSVINRNPTINQIITALDDEEFAFLKSVMNTKDQKHFTAFDVLPEEIDPTICLAVLQFKGQVPLRGILWNKQENEYYLINVFNGQRVDIYHITNGNKVEQIKENCNLLEIRYWILAKEGGGSGGEIDPAKLAAKMEGSAEVVVDLNASGTKVKVDLHAKRVDITAPETATSGTLTDEQLAALHESYGSYIVFNREKYYFNDNAHVSGFLGYSHVGYENSKFILKNITVTENTKGWVLNTEEIGGGVAGVDFAITLIPLNPQLTAFQVTSNNFAEEIADYVETHGKMPKVAGIVVAGDDKYLCLGTQIDVEDDGVVFIGVTRNQWYSNTKEELHFSIEMQPGHSGTTAGQSVSCDTDKLALSFYENYTGTTVVSGVTVPELTVDQVRRLSNKMISGFVCVLKNGDFSTGYKIITAKPYKTYDVAIQIRYEDKDVIYYIDESGADVQVGIDVLSGGSGSGKVFYKHDIKFHCDQSTADLLHIQMVNDSPTPISSAALFMLIDITKNLYTTNESASEFKGYLASKYDALNVGVSLYYIDRDNTAITKDTYTHITDFEDTVTEY